MLRYTIELPEGMLFVISRLAADRGFVDLDEYVYAVVREAFDQKFHEAGVCWLFSGRAPAPPTEPPPDSPPEFDDLPF